MDKRLCLCDIGKLPCRYIIEICFCKLSVVDHVSFCVSFSYYTSKTCIKFYNVVMDEYLHF